MLENLLLVTGQVITLFLMMAAGFVLVKVKMLGERGIAEMSTLLFYVVTPCIILDAFQQEGLPSLPVLGVGLLVFGAYYLIFLPVSALLFRRKPHQEGSVLRFGAVYGNAGFMGLPLLGMLFGPEALIYGVVSLALFNICQWTHGTTVMGGRFTLKKAILNPGVLGVLIGLPLLLFRLRLPDMVNSAISFMAAVNTPVAMVVIGGQMAYTNLTATFTQPRLYAVSLVKLVAAPAVVALVLLPFHLDPLLYCCAVVIAATPSAGATSIFAQKFEQDTAGAAQLVTLTTLLCILTLPIFSVLARAISGI